MQSANSDTKTNFLVIGSVKSSSQTLGLLLENNSNLRCTIISPEISAEWQDLVKNTNLFGKKGCFVVSGNFCSNIWHKSTNEGSLSLWNKI